MKHRWLLSSLIFVVVACLFVGFSTADDFDDWHLIEPLGGETSADSLIIKKSRVIISHQDPDNTHHTKTWRGQSADVEATLAEIGDKYDVNLGADWLIYGMGSTAGTVRESFTLDKEFYGAKSYDKLPMNVVCNTYLVRNGENTTSIYVKFIDPNNSDRGDDKFIELTGLPKPMYKYQMNTIPLGTYLQDANRMDYNIAHEVQAYDWNKDGYSDYLISYVHNPSGNGNFAETKVILAVIDGKSLREGKAVVSALPSDQRPTFSTTDYYSLAFNINTLATPNSLRIVCGDFDGDGTAEAAVAFTKARPAYVGEMGRGDVLSSYKISAGSGGEPFTFTKMYEKEFSTWVNREDAVSLAAYDIDKDGKDELALVSARADIADVGSDAGTSDIHISLRRWESSNNDFAEIASKELETIFYPGFNDKRMPPIETILGDVNGDGKTELLWSYIKGQGAGNGKLNIWVHSIATDEASKRATIGEAAEFDTSASMGWNINTYYYRYALIPGLFHMDLDTSNSIITTNSNIPQQLAVAAMCGGGNEGKADLRWAVLNCGSDNKLKKLGEGLKSSALLVTDPCLVAAAVDSDRESLILGDPTIFYITGDIEEFVEAQAPPKHWERIGGKIYEAFAWLVGYNTKISSTTENSTVSSYTHTGGGQIGYTEKAGVTGVIPTNTPMVSMTAYVGLKAAGTYTSSKANTTTVSTNANAEIDDQIFSRVNDYSMWRYPVIYPSADRVTASGDQMFVQYIEPENTGQSFFSTPGRSVEWYEPLHDHYNIFTYPHTLKDTAHYPSDKNRVYAFSERQLFGNPDATDCKITVSEATSESYLADVQVTAGGSVGVSPQGYIKSPNEPMISAYVSYNLALDGAYGYSSVTTNNLSKMNSVAVNWPNAGNYINSGRFSLGDQQFYGDVGYYTRDDGTLCVSYAVSALKNAGSNLWGNQSPYRTTPDPGLVLPFRLDPSTQSESTSPQRLRIRGGLTLKNASGAADPVTNKSFLAEQIAGRAVSADTDIKCTLRVVNYSFVNVTDPIHVEYLLQEISRPSEAPDITKAVSISSHDIATPISSADVSGVIIPGRESVTSGNTVLDNWIYDDSFVWHTPSKQQLAYLHVKLTPSGTQLTDANDTGHILVGVYNEQDTPAAATISALNVEVREIKSDGTLGDVLDASSLPRDVKLRVKFDVKGHSVDTDKKRFIRGLKFVLVTDKGGLIAGRTIPMFDISKLDGLELDYTPNREHHVPDGMKLLVVSPHTLLGNGNSKLLEFKFKNSSGGCSAGFGILTLLALAPLIIGRRRKRH